MVPVAAENLARLLTATGEAASLIHRVICATDTSIAIWDTEANLLLGTTDTDTDSVPQKHPVLCDGEVIGWISGSSQTDLVGELLSYLQAREAEKEELLEEILDLYRQINLLFNLSDKLAASLELGTVAGIALDEAGRLIEATGGAVVLLREGDTPLPIATIGQGFPAQLGPGTDGGIVDAVVASARADIVNDVRLDPRYVEGAGSIRSLLCAPLTAKNRTLGAIVIVSKTPITYTAAELSLLGTLASQAAPAIENAIHHQKALQEAQEREERLRQQVRELSIELDAAKQTEKVAEITGSEYYQRLRDRADALRSIISDPSTP